MVKDSDSCLANPKYTQWILEAIHKIKKQKQRPSEDRICNAVRSGRGISQALVQEQLELSVRDGNILRVFNKGIASYRDPDGGGSGSGTPSAKGGKIGKSTNLLKLVETAIQELAEGGSSLKSIEKYIRQSHRLEQSSASELGSQLRLAVKKGVNSGRLGKDGRVYRIKELSDPPVKKGGKEDGTKTPGNDGVAATTTSKASKVSATLLFNYGKASCSSLHYHNLSLVLTRGKLVYFLGHFKT